jgi:uncharacterized protein (DUF2249 family)
LIRADDRVSAVLARTPGLLEVFLQTSSSFSLLKNPAARRTMAKLVTIEQAARIAGIETQTLLDRLNGALGEGASEPASSLAEPAHPPPPVAASPEASTRPDVLDTPADRLIDLDVREDLRAGREPLRRIMDAARAVPPDHVLRLRAIFEPAPLYAVLGKQGFAHHTERLAADDWRIWFFRDSSAPGKNTPAPEVPSEDEDDVIVLDVRELEPPEPMQRTLEALATLERGKTLVQINARVPQFLLPKLEERGFTYEIREQSEDLVRIFIRHVHP